MSNLQKLIEQTETFKSQFLDQISGVKQAPTLQAIEALRIQFLGRKGHITGLMESIPALDTSERPGAGKVINQLRNTIEQEIVDLKNLAKDHEVSQLLNREPLDLSLPVGATNTQGSLHPVTLMRKTLTKEFRRLGFTVVEGPEVDLDFYNFQALNFQDDHPARDMQDTFFVDGYDKTVLRTQTSNIQIHAMLANTPPLRVVALGRTYRCDSDLTHTPMFHQVEGFIVDRNISLGDLKGVVDQFLKAIFGNHLETRLRPSFFPFVEPGGEVDLQCVACTGKGCRICKNSGWLEVGGLGMIHPNVFEQVGYDSETYTGFAFGFGIDRMAMLKYGIKDLRVMFEGNRDFQSQFPINSH